MDAMQAMLTRRSIRRFTDAPVSDEVLEQVLRAAMAAPSAGNEQPWRFVIVREREALRRLSRTTPFAKPLEGAAVGLVVCADKRVLRYPGFWSIDCSAAIENLLVAAHASGLGGVWIGVHPMKPFEMAVALAVKTPRHIRPMSLVALGHPAEDKPAAERYEPGFVHVERWEGDAGRAWGSQSAQRRENSDA
ncbi:MAG TPA: nitroreductase family protein [Coriobacteriia bacterium]|nr:nitroreductase family protein [Coriobacteriia bacterium]